MNDINDIIKRLFDALQYNIVPTQYTITSKVKVEKGCNTFTVTNLGTSIIRVNNNITLFPSVTPATVVGDSIVIGGNVFEVYKGEINVTVVLPAGAAPLYEVIQKFYLAFEK